MMIKHWLVLLFVSIGTFHSTAQPGSLFTGFGNGGKINRNIGDSLATGGFQHSSVLQTDGKIIVPVNAGLYTSTLLRINTDGKVDSSFGVNGYGAYMSGAHIYDIALQADGKIVVAGTYYSSTQNLALVARYNTNGAFDTSFNHTGIATRGLGGSINAFARAVAIQADGKIVIAGADPLGSIPQMAFYRLNADGSRDGSFANTNGKFVITFGTGNTYVTNLAIQPDGKIVGIGPSSNVGNNCKFAVVRLTSTGTLDNTFDGDGQALTQIGNTNNIPYSVALQSDGKIIVAGRSENFVSPTLTQSATICRYNSNGTLDNGFNSTGIAISNVYQYNDVKVQPDGKIIVAGDSTGFEFALSRFNSNGTTDNNFRGTGRVVFLPQVGLPASAYSVNLKSDGGYAMVGYSTLSTAKTFPVAVLTSTGLFNTSFDTDGKKVYDEKFVTDDFPSGINITPDGKIFTAGTILYGGYPNVGYQYRIGTAQVNADGSNDAGFNGVGAFDYSFSPNFSLSTRASLVQPDGKKLIAGFHAVTNGSAFFVKRLLANGSNDPSFGLPSYANTGVAFFIFSNANAAYGYTMALQNDGKILVAGDVWNGAFYVMGVARFKTNGTLDSTFSSDGLDTVSIHSAGSFCRGIVVQSDGKIVLGGYTKPTSGTTSFALIRLNAGGGTDNSFGNNGRAFYTIGSGANDYGNGIALQADGKIVVAGDSYDGSVYTMGVLRANTNGTADNTFNSIGNRIIKLNNLTTYAKGIAIQSDNKIVVGGLSTNSSGKLQFAVTRLTATGALDNSFGTAGVKEHDLYPGKDMNFGSMVLGPNKIYLVGYSNLLQLYDFIVMALNNDAGPLIPVSTSNNGICPGSNTSFLSDVTGSSYQWQADNGSGFSNLSNTAPYSGITSNTLSLTNPSTSLYGYKYRCLINGSAYSQTYTLKFASNWTGTISTAWETTGNWSCGAIPDANTDVYINTGSTNYPKLNSQRSVRSIHQSIGTTLSIEASQQLIITGK